MSHPVDFQGKIKQENKPTLHLSQVSNKAGGTAQTPGSHAFAAECRIPSGLRVDEEARHDGGMCLRFRLLGKSEARTLLDPRTSRSASEI